MSIVMIYSTFPDHQAALAAAQTLVSEKLIACANLLDGATSVYRWEGKLENAKETVFLAKTSQKIVADAVARLREIHPYELPAIVVYEAKGGFPAYLQWVEEETVINR